MLKQIIGSSALNNLIALLVNFPPFIQSFVNFKHAVTGFIAPFTRMRAIFKAAAVLIIRSTSVISFATEYARI